MSEWLTNRVPLRVSGQERFIFKTWWDMLEGSQHVSPNFESNGCSKAPDSIRVFLAQYRLWPACHIHDWRYHCGGTWRDRLHADNELRRNIVLLMRAQGAPRRLSHFVAWAYWAAVRRHGGPFFKLAEAIV